MRFLNPSKRSNRHLEVLRFYVENEASTIYNIKRKKGISLGSLHPLIKNLVKQNLIRLDFEKSKERGRNATIYTPTFKGVLVYLSNYNFPHVTTYRVQKPKESDNEAREILTKKVTTERKTLMRKVKELDKILERNGEKLQYPLFQYSSSLQLKPRLYQLFTFTHYGDRANTALYGLYH